MVGYFHHPCMPKTIAVDRVDARIARASEEELARVLEGLNEILGYRVPVSERANVLSKRDSV
jgi:hypothetical protein